MIKRSAAARECDSSGRRLRTYLLKDWRTFAQLFQADGRCAKSCLLKGGTFPFISCFLVPERQAAISPSFAWRLHPRTKKARKGNVGTSVEWRLNSENDSRLHGQPSFTINRELFSADRLGTGRQQKSDTNSLKQFLGFSQQNVLCLWDVVCCWL